jgi:arsenate reductase
MPDPAAVTGSDALRQAAFVDALTMISCRIDLLLALPIEKLQRLALQSRVQEIGGAVPVAEPAMANPLEPRGDA